MAYEESDMSKTRVYEWYKHFQDGRKDFEGNKHPNISIFNLGY